MSLKKSLWITALATIGLSLTPNLASAATITRISNFTDTQFNALLASGDFAELFVAEGRIGNNASNGDRELGINNALFQPVTQEQFVWTSGKTEDFTLEYTGSAVKYTVGGVTLSSSFSGAVNDIYIRTRENATSDIRIDNLFFNGTAFGSTAVSEPGDGDPDRIDYLLISQISAPFTLTGKATMSWTGTRPNGSNLAYQIKVGPTNDIDIPEPSVVSALLLTGIGAIGLGKRKRTAK